MLILGIFLKQLPFLQITLATLKDCLQEACSNFLTPLCFLIYFAERWQIISVSLRNSCTWNNTHFLDSRIQIPDLSDTLPLDNSVQCLSVSAGLYSVWSMARLQSFTRGKESKNQVNLYTCWLSKSIKNLVLKLRSLCAKQSTKTSK